MLKGIFTGVFLFLPLTQCSMPSLPSLYSFHLLGNACNDNELLYGLCRRNVKWPSILGDPGSQQYLLNFVGITFLNIFFFQSTLLEICKNKQNIKNIS